MTSVVVLSAGAVCQQMPAVGPETPKIIGLPTGVGLWIFERV